MKRRQMGHPHCKTPAWGGYHTIYLQTRVYLNRKGRQCFLASSLNYKHKKSQISLCVYYSFSQPCVFQRNFTQWQQFHEMGTNEA